MTHADDDRRGFDATSAALTVVTLAALSWLVWLRFGPPAAPEPPAVGASVPALRLLDLSTAEPLVLLGLKDKVVWITFWSAASADGAADLAALEAVWNRLKPHSRFAMAAAADSNHREQARAAVARSKADLPAYLAAPETLHAFGARPANLPLHILLDPSGRVAAVARGRDQATLSRLADKAEKELDEIEPVGKTRFAAASSSPRERGWRN